MKTSLCRFLSSLFALAAVGASERLGDSSLTQSAQLALREPATESVRYAQADGSDWQQTVATVVMLDSRGRQLR